MKLSVFANFRRPVITGLLIFLFLLLLTQFLAYQRYLLAKEAELTELNNEAHAVKGHMQTILSYNLSTAQTLGFIVQKYGTPRDFDSLGAALLRSNKFVDVVQLLRGGIITHVYPLKGNEIVIGHNILKDSARNSGALAAIKTKKFFWAGPLELKQGGVAIIGRQPLFKNDKFLGFSAVIIKLPTFLRAIGIDSNSAKGFYYRLSRVSAIDGKETFFLSDKEFYKDDAVASANIPDGEWRLYVGKKGRPTLFFAITFSILGIILSVIGGLFGWYFVRQPEQLGKLVEERTRQLSISEKYFRALIEKSSDAIVLVNREGKVIYQSPSTGRISGYTLAEMQSLDGLELVHPEDRKSDFESFKLLVQSPGLTTNRNHRFKHKDGHYMYIEGTYTNLLDDDNVGAIVYNYHDVTERAAAEDAIKLEKNMSESIINSLPGVFYLYDQSGKFIRWNKNFETITGYSSEEISRSRPLDFFDFPEKESVRVKIQEVFRVGMADIEAPFRAKDGNKIPYYFTGHIANFEGKDYLVGMGIDVAERKRAENEIVLEKNLSESIINSLPGLFYLADLGGKLLRWNKNFEIVSGYTPAELGSMHVIQFVDKDEEENMRVRRQVAIEKGMSDVEINFLTRQGHKVPYYFTSLLSKYNNEPCLLGVGIDLAGRKKAEEQVVMNEQKYRSLIEQASDPIMITDFQGNFVDVNSSLCNLSGYSKEELLKLNVTALMDMKDLEKAPIQFELLAKGQQIFSDRRMMKKDGSMVEMEANTKKVNDNYIMSIARDVTQLRQAQREIKISEARFRGAFEYSSIGMAITTPEGKWLKVNRELCNITGFSEEELLQLSFQEITHPEDLPMDLQNIRQVLDGVIDSFNSEKRYFHKSGAVVWVHLSVSIVKDPQGKPLYFVAQIENINAQKKAKEDLRESEERYRVLVENATEALVVLDLEKGKFVSVSKSAEQLFGMSIEELLQVGPIDVSPEYQPNGILSAEMAMKELSEAANGGKPHFEWTHRNKYGKLIPCEIWLVRLPSEQQILIRGSIVDISERKLAEKEKDHARYLLNERVKELTTLYKTGRILQTEQHSTDLVLQEIVNLLPSGWQYPDICEARIMLGNDEYETPEFTAGKFHQAAEFSTVYGLTGVVEVAYLEERSQEVEGPFLIEERNLINMLAEMIRVYLNQKYEAEELNSSYIQLRRLSSHLQTIREEERTGIAREIHDELGQQLTALKMDTSWLIKKIGSEESPVREKLHNMTTLIDDTVKTLRRISSDLRPGILDDLGLIAALEWQSNEFEKRSGLRCIFRFPEREMQFERNLSTGVFRIYQEALTNVMRHSGASLVETVLETNADQISLTISDNGIGFDMTKVGNKKTLGLIGMKERALMFGAELTIESREGTGTTVVLRVPLILFDNKAI